MTQSIYEAIVNGEAGINVTLSAADLRKIIGEMCAMQMARAEAGRDDAVKFYTAKQVAKMMRVHINTLYNMVKRGELIPDKGTNPMLFSAKTIKEYTQLNNHQ